MVSSEKGSEQSGSERRRGHPEGLGREDGKRKTANRGFLLLPATTVSDWNLTRCGEAVADRLRIIQPNAGGAGRAGLFTHQLPSHTI